MKTVIRLMLIAASSCMVLGNAHGKMTWALAASGLFFMANGLSLAYNLWKGNI